jgi:2-keto-4-pentenoate hydratase/2-oxohepta-3-ene-1,7-dioic acid hydratase in catechol pathway
MDEVRDPGDLWLTCAVNGVERMRVNTADQFSTLGHILEHFSRHIAVEPGDMFATGSPGGVAVGQPDAADQFLKPGDVVECAIEGLITLRTSIVAPEKS